MSFKEHKDKSFPTNVAKAYETYLLDLAQSDCKTFTEVKDLLEVDSYGEPFFRRTLRKKQRYEHFSNQELNPLNHIEFSRVPKAKYLHKQWFTDINKDSKGGELMEAWLACHAIQHKVCFNCKSKGSLRWCRGLQYSFQDLLCVKCGCIYEVKTKQNKKKVKTHFDLNRFPGGSFNKAMKLLSEIHPDHQKRCLVVLPREAKNHVHVVQIADVKSIMPKVSEETTDKSRDFLCLKSSISVDLRTKNGLICLHLCFVWMK